MTEIFKTTAVRSSNTTQYSNSLYIGWWVSSSDFRLSQEMMKSLGFASATLVRPQTSKKRRATNQMLNSTTQIMMDMYLIQRRLSDTCLMNFMERDLAKIKWRNERRKLNRREAAISKTKLQILHEIC
ncbi:uncharacterized protein LOC111866952 [Cryptotermes secundus]|uniref:uncharacterized protein LOC111866952 n=1 Tax=Cryptotermes secundus TaxID=105785 RepID=UPI000CD7D93B|nr:uncharacterized protein LOC111866952 [Cryptotermes secundus]